MRTSYSIAANFVRVFIKEPEKSYDEGAKENKNHFHPLFIAFIELRHNDLAAGHIDEGTSRNAQEDYINEFVTVGNRHANDNSNWGDDRKY